MEIVDLTVMKHSLTINNQKMVCQYCNSICIKNSKDRKRYWWWECKSCKVNFLVSLKGNIDVIEYESKEQNNKFYSIHIQVKSNKTDILVWNKTSLPTYVKELVTSFNQLLEITPQNFETKLKTYLLLL